MCAGTEWSHRFSNQFGHENDNYRWYSLLVLFSPLIFDCFIFVAEGVSMSGDSSGLPTPPVLTGGLGAKDKSTRTLDVIVSVSDDHTARVFHFNGHDLQQQQLQQQAASAISGKVGSGYAAGSAL